MDIFFSQLTHGLIGDEETNMYPSRLYGYMGEESRFLEKSSTYFGIVQNHSIELERSDGNNFSLHEGMYFSCPGPIRMTGPGSAIIFERKGYRGLFQIGGPVEERGRLVYIDNCSATLLVAPARLGDPCLNLLTFPPNIEQSLHVHPTIRMGAVLAGQGTCLDGLGNKYEIKKGSVFCLREMVPHCFHSRSEPLVVIAYHPDSDVGPTDSSHPMLSRTYKQI